jgi:hypothetical protein
VLHIHYSTLRIIAGANVIAAGVVVLTVMPNITESEIVGLTTAVLVAWNTWRASKNDKVVKSIHTLTNSAMGAQLKLNLQFAERFAVQAHRLASITKETGDLAAAVAADVDVEAQKSVYQDHLLRQAKVDATTS